MRHALLWQEEGLLFWWIELVGEEWADLSGAISYSAIFSDLR